MTPKLTVQPPHLLSWWCLQAGIPCHGDQLPRLPPKTCASLISLDLPCLLLVLSELGLALCLRHSHTMVNHGAPKQHSCGEHCVLQFQRGPERGECSVLGGWAAAFGCHLPLRTALPCGALPSAAVQPSRRTKAALLRGTLRFTIPARAQQELAVAVACAHGHGIALRLLLITLHQGTSCVLSFSCLSLKVAGIVVRLIDRHG